MGDTKSVLTFQLSIESSSCGLKCTEILSSAYDLIKGYRASNKTYYAFALMLIFWTFFVECVNTESSHSCFFKDETVEIYKNLNTSAFASGRLILRPLKEKGHQSVHMDTVVSILFFHFHKVDYINRKS